MRAQCKVCKSFFLMELLRKTLLVLTFAATWSMPNTFVKSVLRLELRAARKVENLDEAKHEAKAKQTVKQNSSKTVNMNII